MQHDRYDTVVETTPRKGRNWFWIIAGIVLLVVVLSLGSCQGWFGGAAEATPTPNPLQEQSAGERNARATANAATTALALAQKADATATPKPTASQRERSAEATATAAEIRLAEAEAKLAAAQAEPTSSATAPEEEEEQTVEAADAAPNVPANNPSDEGVRTASGSGYIQMPETVYADDGTWRVRKTQDWPYAPGLGYQEPGFGTNINEIGIMVGWHLSVNTSNGRVHHDGGCQLYALPPETYAKNGGVEDGGYHSYEINTSVTSWENELLVLTWEAAVQQRQWEGCWAEDMDLLDHVFVLVQDGEFVTPVPWREYRRASGVDRTIMFGPGDTVYGWHLGLGSAWTGVPGQNGQDNLCDGGNCYLAEAPTFGWVGGGIINSTWPGEIPDNAVPVPQSKIDQVMATLPK